MGFPLISRTEHSNTELISVCIGKEGEGVKEKKENTSNVAGTLIEDISSL